MPSSIDEFHKKVEITIGAIVMWTTIIISVTFSASTIYWNFNALSHDHESDIQALTDKVTHVDERLTKINTRNGEKHQDQEFRIREIESKVSKLEKSEKEFEEFKDLFFKEYKLYMDNTK